MVPGQDAVERDNDQPFFARVMVQLLEEHAQLTADRPHGPARMQAERRIALPPSQHAQMVLGPLGISGIVSNQLCRGHRVLAERLGPTSLPPCSSSKSSARSAAAGI